EATVEVNWQNVAQEQPMTPDQPTMPILPQQAASPAVEDFLPDAPDKKKDRKDGENPPAQR
ncbi:hypothetical protein, partial [Rhizocola hellebori]|uniref:hypothetical protein n=1 Tax=Rhizocola hellebori TaxID=1392758 RepID=UPI001944FCAF